MEKKKKFSTASIASMILCVLIVAAFFLPISSGNGMSSFSLKNAYNLIGVIGVMLNPSTYVGGAAAAFSAPLIIACIGLVLVFVAAIVLFVLTLRQANISVRRVLSVCILFTALFMGFLFNSSMTSIAKTGNNYYEIYPEFKMKMKVPNGSVNNWVEKLNAFEAALAEEFPGENVSAKSAKLKELVTYAQGFDYKASESAKKKGNSHIFEELKGLMPVERQPELFAEYFNTMTKEVSAISSTYGIGYILMIVFTIALSGCCYCERSKEGYKNNGIPANCMFVGIMTLLFVLALIYPIFNVSTLTGLTKTSLLMALFALPKVMNLRGEAASLGINAAELNQGMITLAIVCFVVSLVMMMVFIVYAAKKKGVKVRRIFSIAACVFFLLAGLLAGAGFGESGLVVDGMYFLLCGISIAAALIPFTVYLDKERYKVFSVINVILFLLICAFIIVPLWKVFVDSLDAQAGYGLRMWPKQFSTVGYQVILSTETMRKPFLISVLTTVCGTLLGLIISTLGAYVLIQFEMPGRNFLANLLLFTMIFQAGMIPTYLVMVNLHLTNTLWVVVLLPAINVYNLVLMRNFFEGIPKSLFESASIDGCTPMGTFVKIVLPLSKAALASIGLMFAVSYWNDYTNYKLYITDTGLHNFQMKLRALFFSSDMPEASDGANAETLKNAAIMVAILPFMIVYPFLQKYFVKGVNVGAVKE